MAIKIAAWNVEGRLHGYQKSGRGTAGHILKGIAALDADVLVLPEFYMDSLAPAAEKCLKELGYKIFETAYGDVGRDEVEQKKWGEMHIGIASRLPVSNMKVIRPGGVRNLLVCHVEDPETSKKLRVIAAHLDDRTEAARLKQVKELVEIINGTDMPTVILGDFNAMWRRGKAKLLASRLMRFLASKLPHKGLRSVILRVVGMAMGTSLAKLASLTTLREADPRYRSTATPKRRGALFVPSIRLIQIDHMLVSPDLKVGNFQISKDGGSDHRAISATLVVDSMLSLAENKSN